MTSSQLIVNFVNIKMKFLNHTKASDNKRKELNCMIMPTGDE